MMGALTIIGVGPGDPELLTLKAVRVIRESKVIFVPKGRDDGSSLALSIVENAVSLAGKEIIEAYFPMRKTRAQGQDSELDQKWDATVKAIIDKINSGEDVVFITIGDPTIYSTYFYLHELIMERAPDAEIRFVPGISSINASAATAGIALSLANEKIAVLPANYLDELESTLEKFDTIILMKVNKVFNHVLELLEKTGLTDNAICVSRAGMEDEKVYRNIKAIDSSKLDYFSTMIVKK